MTCNAERPAGIRGRLHPGGGPLVGSLLLMRDPSAVEAFALADWDFVILDLQHGAPGVAHVPAMIQAAEPRGTTVLARVAAGRVADLVAWCDWGLSGFLLTDVHSADEAARAVQAVRFAPEGRRSLNPFVRAAGFGAHPVGEIVRAQNGAITMWVMAEDGDAESAGRMASVPGIDCVFVGPYDLSLAMGRPGDVGSPDVRRAVRETCARAHGQGKAAGVFARDVELARAYIADGADVVALGVDLDLLRRHLLDLKRTLLQPNG